MTLKKITLTTLCFLALFASLFFFFTVCFPDAPEVAETEKIAEAKIEVVEEAEVETEVVEEVAVAEAKIEVVAEVEEEAEIEVIVEKVEAEEKIEVIVEKAVEEKKVEKKVEKVVEKVEKKEEKKYTTFVVKEKYVFGNLAFVKTNKDKIYHIFYWTDYIKLEKGKMFKSRLITNNRYSPPSAQHGDGLICFVELLR